MVQYEASEAERHVCTLFGAIQTYVLNTFTDMAQKFEEANHKIEELTKENDTLKSILKGIGNNEKSK